MRPKKENKRSSPDKIGRLQKVVEKEKGLTLKTSSKEEKMFYTSCDDEEPEIQAKAKICLMKIDDEICNDELDDYDILNNKYEGLLVDFEKLLHKCIKYRKIIDKLTLDLEKTKNDCNEVSDLNLEYKSELNDARTKIETLRLEIENKDKTLNECMKIGRASCRERV